MNKKRRNISDRAREGSKCAAQRTSWMLCASFESFYFTFFLCISSSYLLYILFMYDESLSIAGTWGNGETYNKKNLEKKEWWWCLLHVIISVSVETGSGMYVLWWRSSALVCMHKFLKRKISSHIISTRCERRPTERGRREGMEKISEITH